MTTELKSIYWAGASKTELLEFPESALQNAGYQLHRLQKGNTPQDWKPLTGLGKGITGVYEMRIWESKTTYRVAYVTKLENHVTVLHCWQKTTQATSKVDKDIIIKRYKLAKQRL
jgi:phage-related protein